MASIRSRLPGLGCRAIPPGSAPPPSPWAELVADWDRGPRARPYLTAYRRWWQAEVLLAGRAPHGRARSPAARGAAHRCPDGRQAAHLRRRGITAWIALRGIESLTRLGLHRWRVERSPSWLSCWRRLQVRWDRDCGRWFALVLLACALVCFNRLSIDSPGQSLSTLWVRLALNQSFPPGHVGRAEVVRAAADLADRLTVSRPLGLTLSQSIDGGVQDLQIATLLRAAERHRLRGPMLGASMAARDAPIHADLSFRLRGGYPEVGRIEVGPSPSPGRHGGSAIAPIRPRPGRPPK